MLIHGKDCGGWGLVGVSGLWNDENRREVYKVSVI